MAVDGSDYTMISAPLQFPVNSDDSDMQCENITITDDTRFEGNETFTVTLTTSTPRVDLMNDKTNITVIDNEGMYIVGGASAATVLVRSSKSRFAIYVYI